MKRLILSLISKFFITYYTLRYRGKIFFGKNCIVNWRFSFQGKGKIFLDEGCNLWAHEEYNRFQTYSKYAVICIGKNSRLNGVLLQAREKIFIGENCLLGSTIIMDTDFHHTDPKRRKDIKNIPTKSVIIENNVWLAGQSVVLKGVTIGKNSVVAMRAVVSKDVEKNIVVAGNPAVEVKKF